MNISLYVNTSDKRVVNKSISLLKTVTGSLKTDCNLLTPQLEISYDSGLLACNYVYIPAFNRWYYASLTTSTQRIIIDCTVDVLKTYYDSIKNNTCIVKRSQQSNKYNLYLDDPYFMTTVKDITEVIHFPNDNVFSTHSYILTVAGPRGGV